MVWNNHASKDDICDGGGGFFPLLNWYSHLYTTKLKISHLVKLFIQGITFSKLLPKQSSFSGKKLFAIVIIAIIIFCNHFQKQSIVSGAPWFQTEPKCFPKYPLSQLPLATHEAIESSYFNTAKPILFIPANTLETYCFSFQHIYKSLSKMFGGI